jgi:carbon monoxide dehydrogenase subunit G
MKVEQSFPVPGSIPDVYRFFEEEVERVVRCIPGVESFEDLGEDRYRVKITQRVGSMGATFDLRAKLDAKEPLRSFEFSAVGRSIKGAAGDVRSTNRIDLAEGDNGQANLTVTSNVALGGMLGSMGYRVVLQKTKEVTDRFVENVTAEMARWMAEQG